MYKICFNEILSVVSGYSLFRLCPPGWTAILHPDGYGLSTRM